MRSSAVRCIRKVLIQVSLSAALLATTVPASANNSVGAWSTVHSWPLIAVHAVLMPDGRVLSYGTTASGQQTGNFIYAVWDPSAGLDAGHVTLPNTTGTDIFCSSQVVVPQGNQVFIAGGDNWTGAGTNNQGNNNSNTFDYTNDTLTRNNNMNRARWYSSSIALPNGEIYIQGGSGGTDRPEIRDVNGAFRLLTGANTSSLDFMFPRNFVAPDGRVFGFDSNGRMYYVDTSGSGSVALGSQFTGPTGSDSSAAMFRPGRILQFGGNAKYCACHRHHEWHAGRHKHWFTLVAAQARHGHRARRRPGPRDRRQHGLERDDRRQLQRRNLESDDRPVAARSAAGKGAPLPLDGRADA